MKILYFSHGKKLIPCQELMKLWTHITPLKKTVPQYTKEYITQLSIVNHGNILNKLQ